MDQRPHDLLRLAPGSFDVPDDAPAWAARELTRPEPWVVVRRAAAGPGAVAVGVRGGARRERWAFSVPRSHVRDRITPEALAGERRWRTLDPPRRTMPAFLALEAAAGLLESRGLLWGPGGSAGYELASGIPAVTENSDLDLILRRPDPISRAEARELLVVLSNLPVRPDAHLDTGFGSMALAEWAAGGEVLLRRTGGPVLTEDPWDGLASSESAAGALPGARDR